MHRKRLWIFWFLLAALFIGPPAYLLRQANDSDGSRRRRDAEALAQPPVPAERITPIAFGPPAKATGEVRNIDPGGPIQAAALSPDGRHLIGMIQGQQVKVWDLSTGKAGNSFSSPWVHAMAYSPKGNTAVGIAGNVVYHWAISSGSFLGNIISNYSSLQCVAFAPNAQTIAAGGADGAVVLFNLNTSKVLGRLSAPNAMINAVGYSADGKRVMAAYSHGRVVAWDVMTGTILRDFRTTSGQRCAFSPDGQYFAVGSGGTAYLYDVDRERELRKLTDRSSVTSIAFSPDSSRILVSLNSQMVLYETATGQKLASTFSHAGEKFVLPDNQHVVCAGPKIVVVRMPIEPTTRPAP